MVNQKASSAGVKRLKHALIDTGLEHEDICQFTGLSLSLIRKIAPGHKAPSRRAATRIEAALGRRIFSTPHQYRMRRASAPPIIEFDEAPAGALDHPQPDHRSSLLDQTSATQSPTTA